MMGGRLEVFFLLSGALDAVQTLPSLIYCKALRGLGNISGGDVSVYSQCARSFWLD